MVKVTDKKPTSYTADAINHYMHQRKGAAFVIASTSSRGSLEEKFSPKVVINAAIKMGRAASQRNIIKAANESPAGINHKLAWAWYSINPDKCHVIIHSANNNANGSSARLAINLIILFSWYPNFKPEFKTRQMVNFHAQCNGAQSVFLLKYAEYILSNHLST